MEKKRYCQSEQFMQCRVSAVTHQWNDAVNKQSDKWKIIIFALNSKLPSCIMQQTEANNIPRIDSSVLYNRFKWLGPHFEKTKEWKTVQIFEEVNFCHSNEHTRHGHTSTSSNIQHRIQNIQNLQPKAENKNVLVYLCVPSYSTRT